jgi:hypothetical protein
MSLLKKGSRLTPTGVAEVHRLRATNHPETGKQWTYQQIATSLGVCLSTVYNILKGKTHGGR